MSKKYRIKGSTRRKIMQIELSKEMKSHAKKTKPVRETSVEHAAYKNLDHGENTNE